MTSPINVLVVDDSPIFVEAISEIIEVDPELHVVGVAKNGREAMALTKTLHPGVITMDIHMPVMGGLEAIEHIMADDPTPILVVTEDPRATLGDELHFEALRRGALDVFPKPSVWSKEEDTRADALRERLKLLSRVAVVRHLAAHRWKGNRDGSSTPRPRRVERTSGGEGAEYQPRTPRPQTPRPQTPRPAAISNRKPEVVAIVASTGGPAALSYVLSALPKDFAPPIIITQHIARGFARNLASWLGDVSGLDVRLAVDGERLLGGGKVRIAPDDTHLLVGRQGKLALDIETPAIDGHRPSGTPMLASVARVYGERAIGIILTGMGSDGVEGLEALRSAGALTIAQDESSCVVYGMPKVAVESGAASRQISLRDIPEILTSIFHDDERAAEKEARRDSRIPWKS